MSRARFTETPMTKSRVRGFAAASHFAKSPLRSAAAKRGIAETRLVTHWAEIAGPRLARLSRPIRVRHDRGGAGLGGVLILAVDGPRATEVELEIPQIIERVNAYYGYRAVVDVKLTQTSTPVGPQAATPKRSAGVDPSTLPAAKRRTLEALTDPVADSALRDALTRLGANVMSSAKPKKAPDPAAE